MMFMTAKVSFKKILFFLGVGAAVLFLLIQLLSGRDNSVSTAAPAVSGNDARVEFLKDLGWEVSPSPTESGQVRIPENASELYSRYNTLQKAQGYDLTQFGGKNVMRYVYQVKNFGTPDAPVYATLLVYKNRVIGGDITDTASEGRVLALKKPRPPKAQSQDSSPANPGISQ